MADPNEKESIEITMSPVTLGDIELCAMERGMTRDQFIEYLLDRYFEGRAKTYNMTKEAYLKSLEAMLNRKRGDKRMP